MAYIPQQSIIAVQGNPSVLQVLATVTNTPSISGTLNVGNFPANQSVSGAVSISNLPANQSVSGAISVSNFPANSSISGTVGASIIGLTPVAVTNTPSISGTVLVGNNLIASVSGTVITQWSDSSIITKWQDSSVLAVQKGAWATSAIGVIAPSSAVTSVASSTSNRNLLASNTARRGATIANYSETSIMVKLGSTATVTDYTVLMGQNSYYEVPFLYSGAVDAISSSTAGMIRITELS